jgi:hypothetical protein
MTNGTLTQEEFDTYRDNANGSDNLHRALPFPVVYTDGVKFVAERAEADWLISDIIVAAITPETPASREPYQTWVLDVNADKTATLRCEDRNSNTIYEQRYNYTDFPLKQVSFFLMNNTLMLPDEY